MEKTPVCSASLKHACIADSLHLGAYRRNTDSDLRTAITHRIFFGELWAVLALGLQSAHVISVGSGSQLNSSDFKKTSPAFSKLLLEAACIRAIAPIGPQKFFWLVRLQILQEVWNHLG